MIIEILDMPDLTEMPERTAPQRVPDAGEQEAPAGGSVSSPAAPCTSAGLARVAEPSSRSNRDGAA